MADYTAEAAGIYDPLITGEQQTLDAAQKGNQVSFDTQANTANTAYTDALKGAGKARDTATAGNDFQAQTHGLWSSGLIGNQQRLTYQTYLDNASKINEQRAQKLTDIASRRTASDQAYHAQWGAIASKYGSQKAQYVLQHQDADAKAAAANAARVQAAQVAAASRASSRSQRSVDPATGYGMVRDATTGGLAFHGQHGQPISVGAYYGALGGTQLDIAQALSTGSSDDKKIAADITGNKLSLQQIGQKYPWLLQ